MILEGLSGSTIKGFNRLKGHPLKADEIFQGCDNQGMISICTMDFGIFYIIEINPATKKTRNIIGDTDYRCVIIAPDGFKVIP